jgi:hypothetical protein
LIFEVSEVQRLTLEIHDVKRKLFPLKVMSFDCNTPFTSSKKFHRTVMKNIQKRLIYLEVKMFFDDLDVMKLYSFEGGFHFREYENISWCIVR